MANHENTLTTPYSRTLILHDRHSLSSSILAGKSLDASKASVHRKFCSRNLRRTEEAPLAAAAIAQHTVTMSFFRNPSSSSSCLSKSNKALARLRRFLWTNHKTEVSIVMRTQLTLELALYVRSLVWRTILMF